MTLVEFLLARIAEDEAVAVDCKVLVPMGYSGPTISWLHGANREHGRRWDPDRVLAECEAKKEIVRMHSTGNSPNWDGACDRPDPNGCPTLDVLAMPCKDHPDWREAWT